MKRTGKTHRGPRYQITIYVAGNGPRSQAAISNIKKLCAEQMPGRFKIQIIDVTQQPHLARQNNLIALPMAVRTLPAPIRKIVGDFRNEVGSTIQVEMTATDKKGAIRKNINKGSKHV